MKLLLLAALVLFPSLSHAISQVEAGEQQFHKVDQLAATKAIDDGFVSHLKEIQMKPSGNAHEFLVSFLQEADAGKAAATVTVVAADDGTMKSFTEAKAPAASRLADWGGKAPFDLLEKAVEYVSDTSTDPRLVAFQNGFSSAVINPEIGATGLVGLVEVKAGAQDGSLLIRVDLNGNVLSVVKK